MNESPYQINAAFRRSQEKKKKIWAIGLIVFWFAIISFFVIWTIIDSNNYQKEKAYQESIEAVEKANQESLEAVEKANQESLEAVEKAYHELFKENELQIGQSEGCDKVVCLVDLPSSKHEGGTYSHTFVPEELAAQSVDEAAIVVRIEQQTFLEGTYGTDSYGYRIGYCMEWYDARFDEVIKSETITGSAPPLYANPNMDHYGSPPEDDQVKEWIQETYQSVFKTPFMDVSLGDFHLVLPPSFKKQEDGAYLHSNIRVDVTEIDKAEVDIYELEDILPICLTLVEITDGVTEVSDTKHNKNGVPYFTYQQTKNASTTSEEEQLVRIIGVFAVYETDTAFILLDIFCIENEFPTTDEALARFVKWSELCYID